LQYLQEVVLFSAISLICFQEINTEFKKLKGSRHERPIDEIAIEKCGFYLPPEARYDYLLNLPEKVEIARP
jgi:type I restriction enzyme M protein